MKKALFFAGLATASLLFAGCNKEADVKDLDGFPIEIILSDAQTRTTNAGMSTKWAEGDALSVFYAPAGETTYSANKKFTIQDPETNRATGTVDLEAASNDWYLLYAYASQITSPENTSSGYSYIGCKSNESQKQSGYDDKTHLAGCSAAAGFPLYGIKKNVPREETPVVEMKHVASAVAIKVKNDAGKAIKISKVEFTAPEPIVGAFYVNFAQDPVVLTKHTSYTSATAVLDVQDAPDLAAGETATFYMGIKPFSAKIGDKLSLKITADAGIVEKDVELEAAADFKAGFIKTLNVNYKAAAPVQTITVSDIAASITTTSGDDAFSGKLEGAIVTFVSGSNAFIQDETGGILLYKYGHTFKAGDKLSGNVSGKGKVYSGLKELTELTVETITSDQPIPAAKEMTLAELNAAYDDNMSVLVKLKGVTVEAGFTSRNTTMKDGEETLTLRDQKNGLTIGAGKYDIIGFPSYHDAAQFGVWAQENIIVAADAPVLAAVLDGEASVSATTTSVKVNVTGNVAWYMEKEEGSEALSFNPESGEGIGAVTVSFPANTTSTAVTYEFYVKTNDATLAAAGKEEIKFTITQAAATPVTAKTLPYEEAFSNTQGEFTTDNKEMPSALTYVWTPTEKYGMKASGYVGGTAYKTESWLISPVVDIPATATSPALSFDQALNQFTSIDKAKEEATVWVRIEGGSWTALTGVTYPTTLSWTFVSSGSVDLAAYKGKKIQIGFKYTSTETKAGTWEVKNFKIAEVSAPAPEFSVAISTTSAPAEASTVNVYVTGNVDWTASVTNGATLSDASGTGTKTLTVSIPANTMADQKSYVVTVQTSAEVEKKSYEFTITQAKATVIGDDDVVFTFSEMGLENDTAYPDPFVKDGVSVTFGGGGNTGKYYTKGNGIRVYGNGTVTVASSKMITKIAYVFQDDKDSSGSGANKVEFFTYPVASDWTINVGTFTHGANSEWSGSAGSVVLTRSEGKGHWRLQKVVVTCGDTPAPAATLTKIELSGQTTEFNVGDTFTFDGTVTATYSDNSTKTVTPTSVSSPDMSVAGTPEVTVTYTEGEATATAKYTITVKAATPVGGAEYTLTPSAGSDNGYANAEDIVIDGITWNVTGNSTLVPWRLGGKSLDGVDRAIYSKTPMNHNIGKIVITHGEAKNITVNSMTVIVATDVAFTNVVSTLTPTFAASSSVTVEKPAGANWDNCYYKIIYNVTVTTTSNKFLEFSKAEFFK